MEELVRWLGEQLDADERIARAADTEKATGWWWWPDSESAAERHIAEHNPDRVLREIDAKRKIVERYAWLREHGDTGGTAWVLPLLALPYADRPGYREEWHP